MEAYEAIEKRRSIRIFKQGVSEEQLRKIILAGTKAPSAGNRQPWEFIIIDDQKIIDQRRERDKTKLNKMPCIRKNPSRMPVLSQSVTRKGMHRAHGFV